jgi:O-antigen/teichoic acid export membrane protein
MKNSYSKNYIKIYFWKGFSLALNLISMIIVVPFLSSNQAVYGIYMLCVSTSIYLSYADIGFIGAGFKYSAEYFAKGDLESEIKMQGFVHFVLFLFVSVLSLSYLFASIYPHFLIKDLNTIIEESIASKLLLVQAIFSFTVIFQRLTSIAFGIRLEEYVVQKLYILASVLKIFSVLYFFRNGTYDIVGYFLFAKSIELITGIAGLLYAKYRYNYDLLLLLRSFRYSAEMFKRTKKLALGSFYVTIMWIIYYELDSVIISKYLGAEALAIYAIGMIIAKLFRSMFSILYAPFDARFNHYIGQGDHDGLLRIYNSVIITTMPFVVLPVLSVIMLREPLIMSWVGEDYLVATNIVFFLTLSRLFTFIQTPTSSLIKALERIKDLYLVNSIMAIVYWAGILVTIKYWEVDSFAIMKFVSFALANSYFLYIALKVMKANLKTYLNKIVTPFIFPFLVLVTIIHFLIPTIPFQKGVLNFIYTISIGGFASVLSLVTYYACSSEFRLMVNSQANKLSRTSLPGIIFK